MRVSHVLVGALALVVATGCRKKPVFLKATASSATVAAYKYSPYAAPEPSEIVTIAIESTPSTTVTLTGVSTFEGKTSLDTLTDAKGKGKLELPFQDVRGALQLEAMRSDRGKVQRATLADLPIAREPGIHALRGSFDVVPGTCTGHVTAGTLTATGCPKGTRITLATASASADSAPLTLSVDLSDRLVALPAALDTEKPLRIPLPLSVALPGQKPFPATFEASGFEQQVRDRFASVKSGPVSLGPRDARGSRHGAALIEGRGWHLSGDAVVAREIDLVAFRAAAGTRTSSCGTYTQRTTGKTQTLSLTLTDTAATLYDRRSGRVLGRRTFRATGRCGDTAGAAAGGFSGTVMNSEIDKWIAGFLR